MGSHGSSKSPPLAPDADRVRHDRRVAGPSTMILEELLDAGDPRFWDELGKIREPRATRTQTSGRNAYAVPLAAKEKLPRSSLTSFADKWMAHPSPFARRMLLRYVDERADTRGQRPLVRRILANAEEKDDRELLAHLLVAFDHLVSFRRRQRYDYASRTYVSVVVRVRASDRALRRAGEKWPYPLTFSGRTRSYLRRRVLRAFRTIGYRDEARYLREALAALALYEDKHLDAPEKLVASYSLLRILHAGSPVLANDGRRIAVRVGRQLAELVPAPMHAEAWKAGFEPIFAALPTLRSLFVRRQIALYLKGAHAEALVGLPLERLRPLLGSTHPDLASLGAELLASSKGAETMPVTEWLALAEVDDPTAISAIADRMEKVVAPSRVTLADVVRLVKSKHARIADLGVKLLKEKRATQPDDVTAAMAMVDAPIASARAGALAWLAPLLADPKLGKEEHVRDLVDSRYPDARTAGLALVEGNERFRDLAVLWQALSESPYDDVRAFLLRHLDARAGALSAESLARLWATTLLAVHRGSRNKQRALVAIGARLSAQPAEADSLLALLALALRSVREPERRGGIAAAVQAAARVPELREKLARAIPELGVSFHPGLSLPEPRRPRALAAKTAGPKAGAS